MYLLSNINRRAVIDRKEVKIVLYLLLLKTYSSGLVPTKSKKYKIDWHLFTIFNKNYSYILLNSFKFNILF